MTDLKVKKWSEPELEQALVLQTIMFQCPSAYKYGCSGLQLPPLQPSALFTVTRLYTPVYSHVHTLHTEWNFGMNIKGHSVLIPELANLWFAHIVILFFAFCLVLMFPDHLSFLPVLNHELKVMFCICLPTLLIKNTNLPRSWQMTVLCKRFFLHVWKVTHYFFSYPKVHNSKSSISFTQTNY